MREIFPRPQAWQTETALVDQAVVKFMRGPTSRINCGFRIADCGVKKVESENFSGSKVSARSQRSRRISSFVSGLAGGYVETELGLDPGYCGRNLLLCSGKQLRRSGRQRAPGCGKDEKGSYGSCYQCS